MTFTLSPDSLVETAAPASAVHRRDSGRAPEAFGRSVALHLTSSNRYESLRDALLDNLALPSGSPFLPDRIIVPSMAVRRSIELAAADRFGVFANAQFRFLAQWLWEQIAKVVPGVDESSPFAPARLAWRVFRILGDPAFTQAHAPLARYLHAADDRMRYDLALRIATLFDHYITYRQEWLADWSANRLAKRHGTATAFEHEGWQAALWRRIAGELGTGRQHPSNAFFAAITAGTVDGSAVDLPEVVHVFCLPSIPPLYVHMLRELARWMDVHVYMLNPCEAYWEDIVAPRRVAELKARRKLDHHEVGNRLLAQWGMQTKANLAVTLDAWTPAALESTDYVPNEAHTLLGHVQRSMLELVDVAPQSLSTVPAGDRSIEVHVCHSLTRELEVLQDQLLGMFADDASLKPWNVVVVTPSLQDAAPLIDAVFGNAPESRRIPYTITGRARTTQNVAARALLEVLRLASSRFQASAFFELIRQPIVGRRFEIDAAGLDTLREWIRASGIRWGIDARHRSGFEVPALERHTFADGLHRLFLGYASPDAACEPIGEWLPAGGAEGSAAVALGSFAHIVQELEGVQREVSMPKTAAEWARALEGVVETFLAPADEDLEDVRELEQALRTLNQDMTAGAESTPIPIDVVRAALEAVLDDSARGGVPGGGVTFASMSSLRNLPYRVVCAIGLNDGAFPAVDRPLEFDLIVAAPRAGDRQRRAEDRNVFLDLLLAARERLYVSYSGRDIRDNSAKPPSVVVSDLLEALVPASAVDARSETALQAARERLIIVHPLQPFSAEYFKADADPRLRGFDREYLHALQQRVAAPVAVTVAAGGADLEDADEVAHEPEVAFFRGPLAAPGEEWRAVTLARLAEFFRNPCRFLLRHRLGCALPEAEDELADEEPFVAEWRARCLLAERLLPALLEGRDAETVRTLARAGIEYPAGRYGERLLEAELGSLHRFAANVRRDAAGSVLAPLASEWGFDIDGDAWRLHAAFGDVHPAGRVRYRYDETRATDYLGAWIEHLALNAMQASVEKRTIWHSRDGSFAFPPIDDPLRHLHDLLALYVRGLRTPLRFFPKTAWTYVEKGENIAAAERKWFTTPAQPFGEDRDVAYQLCLRGVENPLDEQFVDAARTVFGAAFRAVRDPRIKK